jgi:hypothetical protein
LPLFRLHLALSLSDALAKTTSLPMGTKAKLRCWHRLRLVLKQEMHLLVLLPDCYLGLGHMSEILLEKV